MKKLIAILLAAAMLLCFAGCGEKAPAETTTEAIQPEITETALEILTKLYEGIGADFPVIGGDFNDDGSHLVDGAPGAFDVTNTAALESQLYVPADLQGKLTDCASMMHMMNANTLTVAVFQVSDGADFAKTMRDALVNNQWMCGMPEKVFVASIGENNFVVGFGLAEVFESMTKVLSDTYGSNATVLYDEAL